MTTLWNLQAEPTCIAAGASPEHKSNRTSCIRKMELDAEIKNKLYLTYYWTASIAHAIDASHI